MASDEAQDVRVMISAEQVMEIIPISRTTLFRLERDKLFPQGQLITPHKKLWFLDEIIAWQRDLQDPESALSKAMLLKAVKKVKGE